MLCRNLFRPSHGMVGNFGEISSLLKHCTVSCTISQNFLRLISSSSTSEDECNKGPLKGIRVVDFTRILAGPYATMILGDLGAEIIKIERPGTGDDTRSWVPARVGPQTCYFVCVNRNKKSVALDIKRGGSVIQDLVKKCDILIENFVPGTMDKLGLGYDRLKVINPGLIFCTISGYGTSGPYVNRGGYDVIAASIGGLMHITGPRNGQPCKSGVALTDLMTGLYAHGAIMAALLDRQKTRTGQRIDCNLLSTQLASLVNLGSNYLNAGIEAQRWGTAHESIVPYEAFLTKDDRWITIGAGNNALFGELCDVLGIPDIKNDSRFRTNENRVENRVELIELISAVIETKSCEDWLEKFDGCKFPFGPVNDLKHAFEDPQVKHNDLVKNVGPYKVVGPAVTYSSSGNFIRSGPPDLGQHTTDTLKNLLGYSDEKISELYSKGIIE